MTAQKDIATEKGARRTRSGCAATKPSWERRRPAGSGLAKTVSVAEDQSAVPNGGRAAFGKPGRPDAGGPRGRVWLRLCRSVFSVRFFPWQG